MAIDVLFGTDFMDKHILAILPAEQKVTIQKSTYVAIVKQNYLPVNAVFAERNKPDAYLSTYSETTDNQPSTMKHLNVAPGNKQ